MWIPSIGLAARLGLAAVWLVSGVIKAADPAETTVSVRAYQLLPDSMIEPVATTLPFVEIALGLLLVVGIAVRVTAAASIVVFAVFIAAIASVWARGLSIDCGCFGGGGSADVNGTDYALEIVRDLGFTALAVWLVVLPRTWFALGLGSRASARTQVDLAE